jgi:hypothetical protein
MVANLSKGRKPWIKTLVLQDRGNRLVNLADYDDDDNYHLQQQRFVTQKVNRMFRWSSYCAS